MFKRRQYLKSLSKTVLYGACALSISLPLAGCDLSANHLQTDRETNADAQDFRDALAPRLPDVSDFEESSIPSLQPYIADVEENVSSVPLVSISVNQTVPLKDVLFELAEQAEYDLELDPNIHGSIIFTARNKPFDDVIERICDIGGLRYDLDGSTLRVERDTPYNKTYKIDYLSYVRSSSSAINNDIGVVSGEGTDTGSTFSATGSSESDFWGELEVNLAQVLGEGTSSSLKTKADPKITAVEQNPDVQAVAPVDSGDNVNVQSPDAVLRVESLPVDSSETAEEENMPANFSINKQAGMISVFANEKMQKQVQEYLMDLKRSVTAQVLIEAKILEVSLTDRFAAGIDWRLVNKTDTALNFLSNGFGALDTLQAGAGATVASSALLDNDITTAFVVGHAGNDVQALVEALSAFGTVRALASPRLTVLNNQPAVLNVATNQVFFEVDIDVTQPTANTAGTITIDSEAQNVPEGVLVNVLPSINLENNNVSLALRPTITRIVDQVPDPGIQFIAASNNIDVASNVPVLNVQEIDSVINVRSGEPVVMGGLLQDRVNSAEEGVPVLGEMPVVGNLFKHHTDRIEKTELVILLKATILPNGAATISDTDKDLYRKFSSDRRPFNL